MSSSLQSRLKQPKKHELTKSHSQAQILASKLRQEGVMQTVESVLQAVDQVTALLLSDIESLTLRDSIINLCQHLKVYGAYLEILYKEQLDHAFKIFRDKAQDDLRLEVLSRLHLLELIELRAKGWKGTDGMNMYYRKKTNQCSQDVSDHILSLSESLPSVTSINALPPVLGPGEVLKTSGKFPRPTRIPGKKYCKDEVVIRNADSGKVMGIKGRRVHMIEELSETIISFQRVSPGAKERLVQITGANEESINHAKTLMEDTIKRNASPTREQAMSAAGALTGSSSSINSSCSDDSALPPSNRASRTLMHSMSTPDANLGEYKYTVIVNGNTIKITGDNLDLVRTSKLVLDEYFSGEPIHDVAQFCSFESLPRATQEDLESSFCSSQSASPARGDFGSSPGKSDPAKTESVSNGIPSSNRSSTGSVGTAGETTDVQPTKLRRPHSIIEDTPKEATPPRPQSRDSSASYLRRRQSSEAKSQATNKHYSIEVLAQLAMSPLCLTEPNEWKRISEEYPALVRKVVQCFDAKHYLQIRTEEPTLMADPDQVIEILDDGEV